MPEKLNLLFEQEDNAIESYSQLIKSLSGHELQDIEALLNELKLMTFIEDEDVLYNKLPMAVFYKQLPVIAKADVLVKVVILQQGEGLVLIVPEDVVSVYQDLIENPELLSEKNNTISLYAEVYNLDSDDVKLHDIIKETYLNSGNSLRPFDLTDELLQQQQDKDGEEGEESEDVLDLGGEEDFSEIEDDLGDFEDFMENESAYKKFKKQGTYLESLKNRLYEKANPAMRKNIRVKIQENVLVIEVNNKNIYNHYATIPAFAKRLLTNFGEAIRTNERTQLVDTFSKDGKRYFVIAEDIANNYWYVINEDMDKLDEKEDYIRPSLGGVAKLRRSSIRKESRSIIPYKMGRKIVFVNKKIK